MKPITKSIISRVTILALAALIVCAVTRIYLTIRSDRINSRWSVRLDGSEHELIPSLPEGRYHLYFSAAALSPGEPLPAQITTSLMRGVSSDTIIGPTSDQSIAFSISSEDAFRPNHLRVTIARSHQIPIYLNVAPSF